MARDPILEGVELPKGLRLTKPRLAVLRKFGLAMLSGNNVYSYRPHNPTGRTLYNISLSGQSEYAALRVLVKNGMIGPDSDISGLSPRTYSRTNIIVKPPLGIVAKRLAAQEAMLEERKEAMVDEEARDAIWEMLQASYKTKDLLELAEKHQQALVKYEQEEARMDAAKAAADALPKPLEEALVWLVSRELSRKEEEP